MNSPHRVPQPSLALLKCFGGDVSTWVANALVGLLPQPTSVPTQGLDIQTEWEIGRSLEGSNTCSHPKSRGRTTGLHLPPQEPVARRLSSRTLLGNPLKFSLSSTC